MTITRDAVAAAVRALDLDELAAERWYASKGEVPVSAALAHAFLLSDDVVLALVDLRVGEGKGRLERYAFLFVTVAGEEGGAGEDGLLREAAPGDGAWRALAVAMAEGRTIPALARRPGPTVATAGSANGAGAV